MKTDQILAVLLSIAVFSIANAQPTAITYSGELREGGQPASGSYDLVFSVHDASIGGTQISESLTNAAVSVVAGLFTVTLDFGDGVFTGPERWLEMAVRPSGGGDEFTPLSPRQRLTSAPYAITAAQVSGPVQASQLSGTLSPSTIGEGTITSAMLAPEAVTSSELDPSIGVWTQIGSNIYRSGGNVGIGTAEPSTLLQIHGSAAPARGQLSLSSPPGEDTFLSLYEGDNFKAYLWYDASDDDLRLQNYNELNGGDLSLNPYGGNVGIGTLDPREKLQVNGGNVFIEGLDGFDAPGESAYLYLGRTPNYLKATRNFGMNLGVLGVPDAVTIQQQTGNVGIGTTNPATALDVVGTVTAGAFAGNGAELTSISWTNLTDIPPGFADGVDGGNSIIGYSVTSDDIQNGTIKGEDIQNYTITGAKIVNNTLYSSHLVNEAGLDWSSGDFQEVGLATEILGSVTLDLPSGGFVVVLATAQAQVHHGAGLDNTLKYGISTSNEFEFANTILWRLPPAAGDGGYVNPIMTQGVYYFNAAGPVTFNFLAQMIGERIYSVGHAHITAMFFPTRY